MIEQSSRKNLLVGAGPANLATLVGLYEMDRHSLENTKLIERRKSSIWHPGLRFESSTLQVSFLKDLVSMRNPSSQFSFLSFLNYRGLLAEFAHTNTFYPSRHLFSAYLEWVSEQFSDTISYGQEVVEITGPSFVEGKEKFLVTIRSCDSGKVERIHVDDLVLGLGHEPYIPNEIPKSSRVVHSSDFLNKFDTLKHKDGLKVGILGSGQSAGEITKYLLECKNVNDVTVVGRRHLFTQTDDNPFINNLYTYRGSLDLQRMDNDSREKVCRDLRHTNYAAITSDILKDIYDLSFKDRAQGLDRLKLSSYSRLANVKDTGDNLNLTIQSLHDNSTTSQTVDLLVCATGFQNSRHEKLLDTLDLRSKSSVFEVDESFQILNESPQLGNSNDGVDRTGARVFLINHSPHVGLTEHTLAGLAERAGQVASRLLGQDNTIVDSSFYQAQQHTA